jgi:hypothetical protein
MNQTDSTPPTTQAERSRRHRVGVAARLAAIEAALRDLAAAVGAEEIAVLDRFGEVERQQGRRQ